MMRLEGFRAKVSRGKRLGGVFLFPRSAWWGASTGDRLFKSKAEIQEPLAVVLGSTRTKMASAATFPSDSLRRCG